MAIIKTKIECQNKAIKRRNIAESILNSILDLQRKNLKFEAKKVGIDLADRKVVGWPLSTTMNTQYTVLKAWTNARKHSTIKEGFILHSDRGVQYASNTMKNICTFNKKVTQSMSRTA